MISPPPSLRTKHLHDPFQPFVSRNPNPNPSPCPSSNPNPNPGPNPSPSPDPSPSPHDGFRSATTDSSVARSPPSAALGPCGAPEGRHPVADRASSASASSPAPFPYSAKRAREARRARNPADARRASAIASTTARARASTTATSAASAASAPSAATASSATGSKAMRDVSNRSKVVVRHLPPSLSHQAFVEQIETRFSGSFKWIKFHQGKSSARSSTYSRAYIDFKSADDVIDFHQEFDGHTFVNEKGTQYKALVEYAPNQRVPKAWSKKDNREGTILQDPEYLQFVQSLSKPVELLPSAEVQLERKEAERNSNLAAGVKDSVVITPLMEFVRQKRALKSMPQKLLAGGGKVVVRGSSPTSSGKIVAKRGSKSSMYSPGSRLKEKATYIPRSEEHQRSAEKKSRIVIEIKERKNAREVNQKGGSSNQNTPASDNGVTPSNSQMLLTSKKDMSLANQPTRAVTTSRSPSQSPHAGASDDHITLLSKSSQRVESSVKTPILLQKADQQSDKEKHVPRSQIWRSNGKELSNNPVENESASSEKQQGLTSHNNERGDKQDARRLRNKDRPDRPVWTVRRRGEASGSPASLSAGPSLSPPGSQRQGKSRECDNIPPNKRTGSSTLGHEKQMWVAKPGSGS